MNYLVTGANGYIGRHVVKSLLDRGEVVYAVDVSDGSIDERAIFIEGSIFDKNDFAKINMEAIDCCIHMAWRNGFVHNDDSHIKEMYMHYDFLRSIVEKGIKQLVVMGTMHEVGYWEGAIDENTPCNPISKYGIAKNALRQLCINMAKENSVTLQWIRAYYITGDDSKSNSIFAKILKSNSDGNKYFPFTSGKNKYDFIDVDDLADQISAVAMQKEISGIINCCSGKPISLAERVEKFIEENDLDIKLEYGKFPDRPYDSPAIWGDSSKIEKIINR